MIIVAGAINVKPEAHDAAVAAFKDMTAATLEEDGCISYEFFASLEGPGKFHVYEHWETLEHLDAHGKTDHMATLRGIMGGIGAPGGSVRKFEATEVK